MVFRILCTTEVSPRSSTQWQERLPRLGVSEDLDGSAVMLSIRARNLFRLGPLQNGSAAGARKLDGDHR